MFIGIEKILKRVICDLLAVAVVVLGVKCLGSADEFTEKSSESSELTEGSDKIILSIDDGNLLSDAEALKSIKPEIDESNDMLESSQALKLDTLATVFIEYTETLKLDLKYDPTDLGLNVGLNFVDAFDMDCKHVEETKKGVCKHFSNYLIKRLRAKGVEAYPLYLKYADENKSHQSVLYKAGSEFFVADITSDIVAIQKGDSSRKNDPWFATDTLDSYIKYSRDKENAIRIYYIDVDLTDSSIKINGPKDLAPRIRMLYSV